MERKKNLNFFRNFRVIIDDWRVLTWCTGTKGGYIIGFS